MFEFDENKSLSNLEKHGIDFESAKKLWTAIFTTRGENIRIISVRRSRVSEQRVYEKHN